MPANLERLKGSNTVLSIRQISREMCARDNQLKLTVLQLAQFVAFKSALSKNPQQLKVQDDEQVESK